MKKLLTSGNSQSDGSNGESAHEKKSSSSEKHIELFGGEFALGVVVESDELAQAKDAESSHVFGGLNRLEADERDLHGEDGTESVDDRVGDVDLVGEAAGDHEREHVKRNQVDEEHVATPRGDHVEVGERASGRPQHAAGLHRTNPQPVGQEHAENGNAFVIVRASDRARNVAGHDRNETGSDQAGAGVFELFGEQVGDDCCKRGEERREEHANVANVHGDVEPVEDVKERSGRDHETGIDGAADDTAERVPGSVVEPVVERVEALFGEELGGAVVEIRIELVDDRLIAQHRKETSRKRFKKDFQKKKIKIKLKCELNFFFNLKEKKISLSLFFIFKCF